MTGEMSGYSASIWVEKRVTLSFVFSMVDENCIVIENNYCLSEKETS